MTYFDQVSQNPLDKSSQFNGHAILANCRPLALPSPRFNILELNEQRAEFHTALVNDRPFFLPLNTTLSDEDQIEFPLKEMPLYIPHKDFDHLLQEQVGNTQFMDPFLNLMVSKGDLIGERRNPLEPKVSNLDGHYLPLAIAGAMLSRVMNFPSLKVDKDLDAGKFLSILGLLHDGVEDGLFSFDEIAEISSPYTNGCLYDAVKTLTRQKTKDLKGYARKHKVYYDYGVGIASNAHADLLVPMKWIDITASCLQDYLNSVDMPIEYVAKQMTVLQAMGKTLQYQAGSGLKDLPLR